MNLRNLAAVLGIAAMVTLTASDALAFRMIQNTGVGRFSSGYLVTCTDAGGFVHWNNASIAWRLNTANQGSGKETVVQNALASWTNVASADHTLTYAGTSSAGFVTDGVNVLRWATGEGCSGSCLALTALVLQAGQVIVETDVTFNNGVTWTTNGANYDTEAVAAHELGHALGIHHSNLGGSNRKKPTMYAYYFGAEGRTLATDDKSALQCAQNRYPPSAAQQVQLASLAPGGMAEMRPLVTLSSRPRDGGALMRFSLEREAQVRLQVFDVAGRHIATLVDGMRPAGDHELAWDGTSRTGRVGTGLYFARLTAGGASERTTVILAE